MKFIGPLANFEVFQRAPGSPQNVCFLFLSESKFKLTWISSQDKNDHTLISKAGFSLKCPLCHLEPPGLLLPASYQERYVAPPHPTPLGALYAPNQPAVYPKTSLSPTNQQVSWYIIRPFLPGLLKTHMTTSPGLALPDYPKVIPLHQQHLSFQ